MTSNTAEEDEFHKFSPSSSGEELGRGLHQFVNSANCPIFGTDADGKINEWNDKFAEIIGTDKETAYKKSLVDTFIDPSQRSVVRASLEGVMHSGEGAALKADFETKVGKRNMLMNVTALKNAESNPIGAVIIAQDVTNQEEENGTADQAKELRKLVDQANVPIFGVDLDGNVNEWNHKTALVTGFSQIEVNGKPLINFILPKLQKSVKNVLDMALQGAATSNYELEFVTKSKEQRFFRVNASARRDYQNEIVGVVGFAQDVTETSRMERAIKATANELRQLVDTANAPIFGIDVNGNVNEWNDKTAEITGYTKDEAFNKPLVSTFIVPYLQQSVQEVLDNALRGIETSNYELEFETKTGETRYLLVNATTRRDEVDNVTGVVGVAQDVTESRIHDRQVGVHSK